MRLLIEDASGTVLELAQGQAVLPLNQDEGAQAFEMLTGALAMLCGLSPRSSGARGGTLRARCAESEPDQVAQTSCVVVSLAAPRGVEAPSSKP